MKKLNIYLESILDDEDVLLDPEKDKEIIRSWIEDNYKIMGRLKINNDLTVDCSGDVAVKNRIESLTNGMFSWGKIGGSFRCHGCGKIESLKGAPKVVGGYFDCSDCENLKSLEGAPEKVVNSFTCNYCKNLTSLEGAPKEVGGDFYCSYCKHLTSLEGSPEWVGGRFDCTHCKNLTSLKGSPKKVRLDFDCSDCENLISLEGAPKEVKNNNNIYCTNCPKLKITDSDREKYNIRT